jgi:hypothetical protein
MTLGQDSIAPRCGRFVVTVLSLLLTLGSTVSIASAAADAPQATAGGACVSEAA